MDKKSPARGNGKKACPNHINVHLSSNPNLNTPSYSWANPHNPAVPGPEIAIGGFDPQLLDTSLPTGADLYPATALQDSLDKFASFFGNGILGWEDRLGEWRGGLVL